MNSNLKLTKKEERFANKHIRDFYSVNSNCKYFELINFILNQFENNITDYDELASDDDLENCIIKKLLSVFIKNLNYQRKHSNTGLFGVKEGFFIDGNTWYYKNLIKNEFVYASPIYARSIKELKMKVAQDYGIWLICNFNSLRKFLSKRIENNTPKSSIPRRSPFISNRDIIEFLGEDINIEKYPVLLKEEGEMDKELREYADKIKGNPKGRIFNENYILWDIYKMFK